MWIYTVILIRLFVYTQKSCFSALIWCFSIFR